MYLPAGIRAVNYPWAIGFLTFLFENEVEGRKKEDWDMQDHYVKNCALQLYRYQPVDFPENAMAISVRGRVRNASADTSQGTD